MKLHRREFLTKTAFSVGSVRVAPRLLAQSKLTHEVEDLAARVKRAERAA